MTTEQEKWISSNIVRTKFREILDDVAYGGQHVHVSRYDRPAAVIVPFGWHEAREDVTDLGKRNSVGATEDHPSGLAWEPATSIAQARARVIADMDHLESNCRLGVDVGFAHDCLIESVAGYLDMADGLIGQ